MGKDSGGSAQSQTTTNTGLPSYVAPYYDRLLQRTEAESNQPYTQYNAPRVADFAPDTVSAFDQTRGMGSPQEFNIAGLRQGLGTMYEAGGINNNYNAASFSGGEFDNAAAQKYMNPYTNNVLDRLQERSRQRFGEQRADRDALAIQAGAFGNDRRAVANRIAQKDLNQQLADTEATQMSQAYQSAQGQFEADRAARLQAEGMSEQGQVQQGQMDTAAQVAQESARREAETLGLGAAGQLAGLGQARQAADLARIGALGNIGQMQQQQKQAQLDIAHTDFINQRDFERAQLNFMGGALRGTPVTPVSDVASYQPPVNPLSNMMGAGIAGLGMAQQYQNLQQGYS